MQAATVLWHPLGKMAQAKDPTIFGGEQRAFESIENAVVFVMEELPLPDRITAMIQTDDGSIEFGAIESAYERIKGTRATGGQDGGG